MIHTLFHLHKGYRSYKNKEAEFGYAHSHHCKRQRCSFFFQSSHLLTKAGLFDTHLDPMQASMAFRL